MTEGMTSSIYEVVLTSMAKYEVRYEHNYTTFKTKRFRVLVRWGEGTMNVALYHRNGWTAVDGSRVVPLHNKEGQTIGEMLTETLKWIPWEYTMPAIQAVYHLRSDRDGFYDYRTLNGLLGDCQLID